MAHIIRVLAIALWGLIIGGTYYGIRSLEGRVPDYWAEIGIAAAVLFIVFGIGYELGRSRNRSTRQERPDDWS